jgi:hypothetical protein
MSKLRTGLILWRFLVSPNEYGIGFWRRLALAARIRWNLRKIVSATSFREHLVLLTALLTVSKDTAGGVVECGTYYGASACSLSLLCKIVGRELHIFDSFEGLPTPEEGDRKHLLLNDRAIHIYEQGSWSGPFAAVQANLRRYGAIEVCHFHRGFFDRTLPNFQEPVCFAFCDVDLAASLRTCLECLWPLLGDNCPFFTHEANHIPIAALFYSERIWGKQCPGLVSTEESLGYTIKNPTAILESHEVGLAGSAS